MMEWVQMLLYFLTNGIRIFLCLCLVAALLKLPVAKKRTFLLSLVGATMITALASFSLQQPYLLGIEILFLLIIAHHLFEREVRLCLFIIIFYEIAVALWDFLVSAWLGVWLGSSHFLEDTLVEYCIAVLIVRLKEEQSELLERDFQTLNHAYGANATLFHDLHNHMDILHRYLMQDKTSDALHYLEDFYTPIQESSHEVWTGDKATDYLINSKIALARQRQIETKINIEFPRHTNIRSADLTAILGNLLDNALEATAKPQASHHFINLTIRRIHDMLIVKVENDCMEAPLDTDGDLMTTKTDSGLHGWGLKNARTAVQRYDGMVETTYTDNLFCAVATLSYQYSKPE